MSYSCCALAMRCERVSFIALLTRSALAKRCIFAYLCTWLVYNMQYIRQKLASSCQILTKFRDAHRRTACCQLCHSRRGLYVVHVWLRCYANVDSAPVILLLVGSTLLHPKGLVTHTITHVQRTKKEEFWSVRCDSLGVRQNSLWFDENAGWTLFIYCVRPRIKK